MTREETIAHALAGSMIHYDFFGEMPAKPSNKVYAPYFAYWSQMAYVWSEDNPPPPQPDDWDEIFTMAKDLAALERAEYEV